MDKKYRQILRYICKHPYISYKALKYKFRKTHDLEEIVTQLSTYGSLSFRVAGSKETDDGGVDLWLSDSSHLVCTHAGNEYLENRHENDIKWRIATLIALFAAIGAYRGELACILQVLAKLLRSLTGS